MANPKSPKTKHVSHAFFSHAMSGFNEKLDKTLKHLEHADTNTGYALLQVEKRMDRIEKTMATKEDIARMGAVIFKHDDDIKTLQATLDTKVATKEDIQVVIATIDAFTKKVTVQENRSWFHNHRFDELEPEVKNHEARLSALEARKTP